MTSENTRAAETVTVQGLGWERVTDLAVLDAGQWVRMLTPVPGGDAEVSYLRVVGDLGHSDAVALTRHGRNIPFNERVVGVHPGHLEERQLWRSLEQPASGIPGTWCDGLDDAGDHCGKSLLHEGSCRH
jgi:hypothetical protein